jgi:hypothetical protein
VEEAHVTELTGLLREGPGGDQLDGWPEPMRVFARRERPHPGAQLSLFETHDGWSCRRQGRGVLSSRSPMFGVVVGVVTCFERFS